VDTPHGDQPAGIVVMARVDGDRVIIEEDTTDKPIYKVLMFRGIPREKIILAYAGEVIPEAEPNEDQREAKPMPSLAEMVKKRVLWYEAGGFNHRMFAVCNDEKQVYAVTAVDIPRRKPPVDVVVMARVLNDKVIIEQDTTDRPLYKALMEDGIPRESIVLGYIGEAIPADVSGE
jgi:XisI protein